MSKLIDLFSLIFVVIFFFSIHNFYSSNKNINSINLNRLNIDEILKNKTSNLTILENDTNNILEFNTSFSEAIKKNQPRSFWKLLKFK